MRQVLVGILAVVALAAGGCGDDVDDAGGFCDALRDLKTFIEHVDGPLDDEQQGDLHDIIGRARRSAPGELDDIDGYFVNTETFMVEGDLAFGNDLSQDDQAEYSAQNDALMHYAADTCGIEGTSADE